MDADVMNDMRGRTHPCISLGPSVNWQVSQMCFELDTGKVVLRRIITILPMPERAIKIINDWGELQKNSGFNNKLEFWDRMKKIYHWENEDVYMSDGKYEVEPVNVYPHIPSEIAGVIM